MNIVLVGFMGSGKSKVGKRLARKTGRMHIETDDLVTAREPIADIFARGGEAAFRAREREAVKEAARSKDAVISTGGGTVVDPSNVRELKRNGTIVYLQADESELVRRLSRSKRERPMLAGDIPGRVRELLAQRAPIYESVADVIVRSDERNADRVVESIASKLSLNGASRTDRVRVGTDPPYTVTIGRGLVDRIELPTGAEKAVVISHPRLKRLYGSVFRHRWLTFPEGEASKTFDTAARLAEGLAREGLHRDDVVIAFGGGVVGDVAGFVASTYGRGIRVIQVPTTLLAMVDSSVGGKTGVNLPQGKNLVGTFHQPYAVYADLDVLRTLPARELRAGMAEVVKYAFIADPSILELVERGDMHGIVTRCVKIKADVVASDERDAGRRAILNYGHTLGHAIELASDLHHGEAVAIGMVYAAIVARILGVSDLVDDHRRAIEAVGLPTEIPGLRWPVVRKRMVLDKKYARGDRMVLLEAPGKPVVRPVPIDVLERAWKEL
jgi:3-dehydroquinate synthase/shikimate kinase/3-dehydroquinate synthase